MALIDSYIKRNPNYPYKRNAKPFVRKYILNILGFSFPVWYQYLFRYEVAHKFNADIRDVAETEFKPSLWYKYKSLIIGTMLFILAWVCGTIVLINCNCLPQ